MQQDVFKSETGFSEAFKVLEIMRDDGEGVDVVLRGDDIDDDEQAIKCHSLVLSSMSPYFRLFLFTGNCPLDNSISEPCFGQDYLMLETITTREEKSGFMEWIKQLSTLSYSIVTQVNIHTLQLCSQIQLYKVDSLLSLFFPITKLIFSPFFQFQSISISFGIYFCYHFSFQKTEPMRMLALLKLAKRVEICVGSWKHNPN